MAASVAQHLLKQSRQAFFSSGWLVCVWGEVYKIITGTEKMNKEQLFIIPYHINKIIYPMAGLKTVKTKRSDFPHNKILTHC